MINLRVQTIIVALLLVLAVTVSAGTDDSVSESAFLVISVVSQTPDPASPGEEIELRVKVENRGTKAANDVELGLVPKYPFIMGEAGQSKGMGSVSGRQKGKDAVIVKFIVSTEGTAPSGTAELQLRFKTASQGWTLIDPLNISVGYREVPLTITSVSSEPEKSEPGKPFKIRFGIANKGTAEAVNIRARINITDSMPISGHGSTNEQFTSSIRPGAVANVTFAVITLPDAKSGVYRVPLLISYSDRSGRNYTLGGQLFSVAVGAKSEISAALVDSATLREGRNKVTIELINQGLGDLKFVTTEVAESGDYEVLSPPMTYVGDLDSGDSDTVSYDIFFMRQAHLKLTVNYRDALNDKGSAELDIPTRVYTGDEARKFGLEKSGSKGILVTLAIIATGVLAYKRIRRKAH
ncbi:TPA: hypothetical protein HA231_05245 [Candidatus Woesearchaeota archaeon]|nr:hypothetical protein [Candidatus Woesearchaeota archaeon]